MINAFEHCENLISSTQIINPSTSYINKFDQMTFFNSFKIEFYTLINIPNTFKPYYIIPAIQINKFTVSKYFPSYFNEAYQLFKIIDNGGEREGNVRENFNYFCNFVNYFVNIPNKNPIKILTFIVKT